MSPRLAFLVLPYTRAELPGWGYLLKVAGFGAALGGPHTMPESFKALPPAMVRGKLHGFTMKLDRSDWAQACTYFLGRYYELGVQRVLNQLLREGDVFVDVGAIGMVALHARFLVGATGRVICFEPNPACAASIVEHAAINRLLNIDVRRSALSDVAGTLALNLPSEHTGTATLAEINDPVRCIDVLVQVGDDELRGIVPRVIKIDVEGYEMQVLRGLAGTLSEHKPYLVTELIDEYLVRAGSSVSEVAAFLLNLGYKPFGIATRRAPIRHDVALHARERPTDEFTDWLWK
jgi:FkbM family methyltransferase